MKEDKTKKAKKKQLDAEITQALLNDFDKFEHFAFTYWKQIVYTCVGIVAVVAVVGFGIVIKSSQEAKAVSALANAKTIETLTEAISQNSGSVAVNSAKLRLAILYADKKDYDNALKIYNTLASAEILDELRWRVKLNICYIEEIKGEAKKAAANFSALGSNSLLTEAFSAEANYSAGRIYASLKENDKAKRALELASSAASNFWGAQAKMLLDRLSATASKAAKKAPAAKS